MLGILCPDVRLVVVSAMEARPRQKLAAPAAGVAMAPAQTSNRMTAPHHLFISRTQARCKRTVLSLRLRSIRYVLPRWVAAARTAECTCGTATLGRGVCLLGILIELTL